MKNLTFARPSNLLGCLFTVALFLALTPVMVSAKTFHIKVTDEVFDPEEITIEVGDTVVWTAKSGNAHTMEPGDDIGGTCSENINYTFMGNGDTFSHTFTIAKPCYYTCRLHGAGMNGVVHVKEKTVTTTTTIPTK